MARTSFSRNSYDGGATQASLSASIPDGTSTSIVIANTNSSWDSLGATYGFWLSIGYGLQSEEKVYVPAQTSAPAWTSTTVTLNNVSRGQDGTTAQAHDAAVPVVVVMTATDLDEANNAVSQTLGKITTQGDLLYGGGANALSRLAPGTAGQFLSTNGSGAAPTWVNTSNVWTASGASPSVTVSGYKSYLVFADVTLTQPSTSPAAGSFTLTAAGKGVSAFLGATASATATANLVATTNTSGTISATASKGGGIPATATLSNINLIVVGIN